MTAASRNGRGRPFGLAGYSRQASRPAAQWKCGMRPRESRRDSRTLRRRSVCWWWSCCRPGARAWEAVRAAPEGGRPCAHCRDPPGSPRQFCWPQRSVSSKPSGQGRLGWLALGCAFAGSTGLFEDATGTDLGKTVKRQSVVYLAA